MANFVDQVAERAAEIRVARIILSLIALPFFVIGFVIGVLWVAARWVFAAAMIGFEQVTASSSEAGDDAR